MLRTDINPRHKFPIAASQHSMGRPKGPEGSLWKSWVVVQNSIQNGTVFLQQPCAAIGTFTDNPVRHQQVGGRGCSFLALVGPSAIMRMTWSPSKPLHSARTSTPCRTKGVLGAAEPVCEAERRCWSQESITSAPCEMFFWYVFSMILGSQISIIQRWWLYDVLHAREHDKLWQATGIASSPEAFELERCFRFEPEPSSTRVWFDSYLISTICQSVNIFVSGFNLTILHEKMPQHCHSPKFPSYHCFLLRLLPWKV